MAPLPPSFASHLSSSSSALGNIRSALPPSTSAGSSSSFAEMADELQQLAATTIDEEDEDYSDFPVEGTTQLPRRTGQLTRALINLIELMQRSCSNKLLRALNLTQALDESSTFLLTPNGEDPPSSLIIPSKRSHPLFNSVPQIPSTSSEISGAVNSALSNSNGAAAAAAAGAQYNHERTVQLINNVTNHIARTLNLNTTNCADEAEACVTSLRQLETAARNGGNATAFDPSSAPRLADDGYFYRGGSNGRSDKLADQVVTNSIIQVIVLVIVITILLILTGKMLMDLGSRTGYPAHGGPGARA